MGTHLIENWRTVKPGMSDWPGNDRKITSHSNFKLRFSGKPLDIVRGFLFQFGAILRSLVKGGNHLVENWPS